MVPSVEYVTTSPLLKPWFSKKIESLVVLIPLEFTINLRFSKSEPGLITDIFEIVLFFFLVLNLCKPEVSAVVKPTVLIPAL